MQKTNTRLLRLCCWFGAIFDAVVVVPMLFPQVAGAMFGISDFNPDVPYRYAMFVGASLMAGWTVLLLWADRKPWERRSILLITLFPVLIGNVLAGFYAVSQGFIRPAMMAPTWVTQAVLGTLFVVTYVRTRAPKALQPAME